MTTLPGRYPAPRAEHAAHCRSGPRGGAGIDYIITPAKPGVSDIESGDIDELPESPQHRAWREARMMSAAHIDGFAMGLRRDLLETITLVNRCPAAGKLG